MCNGKINMMQVHGQHAILYIQWNLYIKDTLGPAIFVLNKEVSSSQRLKIH